MRFATIAASLFAVCSAANAHPDPAKTLAILKPRQPISRTGNCRSKTGGRENRAEPCKEIGESCSSESDCCGALLCNNTCYESRY
ncbi:hypothetical protein M0657_010363 [Pyricularia oryzae]|nr:hypothetical protein M0657_010363 [Pyricularia oryzae]KAI7915680.1 hypothetical protein M9X92_008291 [Pyricularia oryzae]